MNPESAIKNAIADHGPITFAEFMQIALYGPGGFYTSGSPISASGDFFTAPSAHPLFGALIAVQLREMWQLLGSPAEFTVVEEGAGSGGLAADITESAATLDTGFGAALNYIALDIAPPGQMHYPVLPLANAPEGITGCVLSNELLDAMPVHRFEVRNNELLEIFVGLDGDEFCEVLQSPSNAEIERRLAPVVASLPDGYRGEVNLGLQAWAGRQSKILERGWALTFDYGFQRSDLYRAERASGSLRTYFQHTLGQDPLRHVGKQDITAHVDFTAVDEAMTAAGFLNAGTTTQAEFLAKLGIEQTLSQLRAAAIPRPVKRANEMGIQALIDPDGMGRFVVTAHSRNVVDGELSGFGATAREVANQFELHLLKQGRHINLTGPQQSDVYFEVQSLEELFSDEP